MRTFATAAFALILLAAPVLGDCPCVPITHVWIVKTCADWTCASTELAVANGDPQVIAVPVGMSDGRWLIVRRLAAGAPNHLRDPFPPQPIGGMTGWGGALMAVP